MNIETDTETTSTTLVTDNYIGLANGDDESKIASTEQIADDMRANPPPTNAISATTTTLHTQSQPHSKSILYNFILMSILFSSNHGCVVACLSLATARLGSLGAYQNGILYVHDFETKTIIECLVSNDCPPTFSIFTKAVTYLSLFHMCLKPIDFSN
jgi:hypothetical protein